MPTPITPIAGPPISQAPQNSLSQVLQNQATADGPGSVGSADGMNGGSSVEIQKTGSGTTGLVLEGSFDQAVWYAIGYQQVDGISNLVRSVAQIAVGSGAVNHIYQLLDTYPYVRARLTGTSGAISLLARLYSMPV
jgi:hypothetical protein